VAPEYHPAFYSSSRLTLNVTRRAMAETGYCPSGRLFEAAACGVPILTDYWEGLESFFQPGEEILVAHTTADAVAALESSDAELQQLARAARDRTLAEHTAGRRAAQLERILEGDDRVGNHTGRGSWNADSAAGLLEGAPAGREPA
jgi:spore maturation protein CgeB